MRHTISMLKANVNYALGDTAYPSRHMATEEMGDRIRTLRESRKLSQEDMGKIVGISGAAVSQWESGATKGIKPENFLRFCAYFAVDPYWLAFGAEGDPQGVAFGRARKSPGA
jgi:transcriptional regulator with XRE-family HTH domain